MNRNNFYTEDPTFKSDEEFDNNHDLKYLGIVCVGVIAVIFSGFVIYSLFQNLHF